MPTWYDLNPLANPLNTSPYRRTAGITHANQPGLTVPDAVPYDGQARSAASLTVPNQDIPPGDQLRGNGFVTGSLFRLSDGTVVDFKRRLIINPARKHGYWGDPDARLEFGFNGGWNEEAGPSMAELVANPEKYAGTAAENGQTTSRLSPEDVKYWLMAEQEAEKLRDSMTDEQKKMLADFEAHFPKSRLIEESKKLFKKEN